VGLGHIHANRVYPYNLSLLSKMAYKQQAMHDGFSDTDKHFAEWVRITKEFLKLAFAGGNREASCPRSRCENRRKLSKYEMSVHLAKKGFMANYLLWH
jgi:hypothetical protein